MQPSSFTLTQLAFLVLGAVPPVTTSFQTLDSLTSLYVAVFMGALPTQNVYAPLVCWCLQRPEEDIGPPGIWLALSRPVGPGTGTQVLPKKATAPNC